MNQQQKEVWVAALRSGKYEQDKGALRSSLGYCCLGVAAEVCRIKSTSPGYIRQAAPEPPFTDFAFLPREIQAYLAEMNDDGKSFDEIADYIEQHVTPTE